MPSKLRFVLEHIFSHLWRGAPFGLWFHGATVGPSPCDQSPDDHAVILARLGTSRLKPYNLNPLSQLEPKWLFSMRLEEVSVQSSLMIDQTLCLIEQILANGFPCRDLAICACKLEQPLGLRIQPLKSGGSFAEQMWQ